MKKYEKPQVFVIKFSVTDVISTSGEKGLDPWNDWYGEETL